MYRVAILTVSDKGAQGLREDLSGPAIRELVTRQGYEVVYTQLLPDELDQIRDAICRLCDEGSCDLLLTTGGTGFAPRDVTPEATLAAGERMVPGIAEAMRAFSMGITPRGMLSRGVAVIRKGTLVINLPGSVKAVKENLEHILPALDHGLAILTGRDGECGRPSK